MTIDLTKDLMRKKTENIILTLFLFGAFLEKNFQKHKVAHIQKSLVIQSKTKEKLKVLIDNKKTLSEIQIFYYFQFN